MSRPMLPPPPGLLSTTNAHWVSWVIFSVIWRLSVSVPPPGVYGTTKRIGLSGQASAWAVPSTARAARAVQAIAMRRLRVMVAPEDADGTAATLERDIGLFGQGRTQGVDLGGGIAEFGQQLVVVLAELRRVEPHTGTLAAQRE